MTKGEGQEHAQTPFDCCVSRPDLMPPCVWNFSPPRLCLSERHLIPCFDKISHFAILNHLYFMKQRYITSSVSIHTIDFVLNQYFTNMNYQCLESFCLLLFNVTLSSLCTSNQKLHCCCFLHEGSRRLLRTPVNQKLLTGQEERSSSHSSWALHFPLARTQSRKGHFAFSLATSDMAV